MVLVDHVQLESLVFWVRNLMLLWVESQVKSLDVRTKSIKLDSLSLFSGGKCWSWGVMLLANVDVSGHSSMVDMVLLVLSFGMDHLRSCGVPVWRHRHAIDSHWWCQWHSHREVVPPLFFWIQAWVLGGRWSYSVFVDGVLRRYLHLCHQIPQLPTSIEERLELSHITSWLIEKGLECKSFYSIIALYDSFVQIREWCEPCQLTIRCKGIG